MKNILLTLLFVSIKILAIAQICTGSVGDPIVDNTFGSGPNPGPPLAPGITNMQYVATTCPLDGQYTLTNYSSGCLTEWNAITDHSGDPNGYFMLVNASYAPSIFFIDTIYNLCPGVSYQFAAWLTNMYIYNSVAILPNLTFKIESISGNLLQIDSTGNIPENGSVWLQYKFNFTCPTNENNVVLVISNNAPGGFGNDFAIDDITFQPIGPDISIAFKGHTGDTAIFCGNIPPLTLLADVDSCYLSTNYQWQLSTDGGVSWNDINGAVDKTYTTTASGSANCLYRLAVSSGSDISNTNCRVESSPLTVIVLPPLEDSLTVIGPCYGDSNGIVQVVAGGGTPPYNYSMQGAYTTNPVFDQLPAGFYHVTITDDNGCYTSDSVNIIQDDSIVLQIFPVSAQVKLGDSLPLHSLINQSGQFSYQWSPAFGLSCYTCPNPVFNGDYTEQYQLTINTPNFCMATASTFINVLPDYNIYIPNAFMPAQSGADNVWKIFGDLSTLEFLQLSVFDRLGEKVFSSNDINFGWDGSYKGKQAPAGVYVYYLKLVWVDGHTEPGLKGSITLLR